MSTEDKIRILEDLLADARRLAPTVNDLNSWAVWIRENDEFPTEQMLLAPFPKGGIVPARWVGKAGVVSHTKVSLEDIDEDLRRELADLLKRIARSLERRFDPAAQGEENDG